MRLQKFIDDKLINLTAPIVEPGLSNKRTRSRLRATYPYSLGITARPISLDF